MIRAVGCQVFASPTAYPSDVKSCVYGGAARDEALSDAVGDRLLPQYFPRRRDPAGPRLLGAERRDVAQDQPDAEFPRPPLYQRPRDTDLGGARSGRERLYVQLRGAQG